MRLLCMLLCASILMGCANSQKLPDQPDIPANLAAPCPPLSPPTEGTGEALLRWGVRVLEAYAVCQDRHRELVRAWPR